MKKKFESGWMKMRNDVRKCDMTVVLFAALGLGVAVARADGRDVPAGPQDVTFEGMTLDGKTSTLVGL